MWMLTQGETDQRHFNLFRANLTLMLESLMAVLLLMFFLKSCSNVSEIVESAEMMMMKKKKKKKAVGTLSVTSMLKKFAREKEKEQQKMKIANQKEAIIMGAHKIPLYPADAAGGGGSGLTDPLLSLIGSTNDHALIQAASTVDFDIDLDSLLDVTEETSSVKLFPQPATETQLHQPKTDYQAQSSASSDAQPPNRKTNSQLKPHPEQIQLVSEANSTWPHQCAPLPEGLPPQLEDCIIKLMLVRPIMLFAEVEMPLCAYVDNL